jgi:transposase
MCGVWADVLKKSRIASERCEHKRAAFREAVEALPVECLVFLDECGFSLNMHRLYGWAIGGERCVEAVPFNKGINRSVLGAYSLPTADNPTGLWALWQKLGAWTGQLFEAFLCDELLPRLPPGCVLVLDNARIHHGPQLKEMVERAGHALLYLPPYSPDYNPIELVWSWLKNTVRILAPRDDPDRKQAIDDAHKILPPQNALAWFHKCGLTPLLSD